MAKRRRRGEVPLERALSKLGVASRAESRRLILAGRVALAGRREIDPELPVVPERSALSLDGEAVAAAPFRVVLFHKPRRTLTTRSDPQGRRTVFDLLPPGMGSLVSVGRLDWATSGLLLLTSSTRLASWLTDPANEVPRVYLATVRGRWSEEKSQLVKTGIVDRGETLLAAEILARKVSGRESHLTITLREGKNREVRRLLAAAGHEVTRLKRVAFGGFELGELAPGLFREATAEEIRRVSGLVHRA